MKRKLLIIVLVLIPVLTILVSCGEDGNLINGRTATQAITQTAGQATDSLNSAQPVTRTTDIADAATPAAAETEAPFISEINYEYESYIAMLSDEEAKILKIEDELTRYRNLYSFWDEKLNEIYQMLMEIFSDKQEELLRQEERQWVESKENYANSLAFQDLYYDYLFTTTKKRTFYLMDLYYESVYEIQYSVD